MKKNNTLKKVFWLLLILLLLFILLKVLVEVFKWFRADTIQISILVLLIVFFLWMMGRDSKL
ncbi:hypothetical protein C4573_04390 [Candidatus Woesearchaeota archaeon]|nr:MAG: hypothetical protein C4573_04390 [Candidatus Woesearchaeota archaeon]